MSCEKCGLIEPECQCYVYELEDHIIALEEGLDQLTEVVKAISDYVREEFDKDIL